ncbi:2826_t:CDS:1, partial [Funneliformis geosporum]
TCNISKEFLTDDTQNIPKISRYHHITDKQYNEILNKNNALAKKNLARNMV